MSDVNEVKIFSYPEPVHPKKNGFLCKEFRNFKPRRARCYRGTLKLASEAARLGINNKFPDFVQLYNTTALPISISYSTATTDYTLYLYQKLRFDQDGKLRSNASLDINMLKYAQTTALKSIKSLAPLLDRILVQRIKAETKTASGIFLPESSVKELNEAKVLAVGPGGLDKEGKRVTPSVSPGDKVLIPQVGHTVRV